MPGMMAPGFKTDYGTAIHNIPGLSAADQTESSTVKIKKFDYTLSKSKIIHLPPINGGHGR